MEEKGRRTAEMFTGPSNTVMSVEECFDNLLHTRDMCIYLDALEALKDKYLIILSIKDTPGHMSEDVLRKCHELGFDNLTNIHRRMYIGISNEGSVVYDMSGEKTGDTVSFNGEIHDLNIAVCSESTGKGNAQIKINDIDYSLNERGLNFVVYDVRNKKIVDSSVYDQWLPIPTFYHRNFDFDDVYFASHFYIPEKYKNAWQGEYRRSFFSNRRLEVKEICGGIIEPLKKINGRNCGGVCDEEFNFIAGHEYYAHDAYKNERHICECYRVEESELDFLDETVIFGGIIRDHPGHLICEMVAERMWWIIKNRESSLRVAVVDFAQGTWGSEYGWFLKEFLDVIDFPDDRIIMINKPTKFSKVIIPDKSEQTYEDTTIYEFTKEYKSFFEYMKGCVKPGVHKKVYLAKKETKRRNIIGEEYFIEFYKNKGFEIVYPEKYTIKEKAELMLGADEVVSPVGTNALYAIFCKPSVKLTMLTRIDNKNYSTSTQINEAAGIKNITIVNVAAGFMNKSFTSGLSLMCVTEEFRKYVKDTYGEELSITPEESLKNILYEYLRYIPEYYTYSRCFNVIKNQKMLTVLQNMSEVFLGKEFDTSTLNLTTNEDSLRNRVKQLTTDLETAQKRIDELEKSDTKKILKTLDETGSKMEKQLIDIETVLNGEEQLHNVIVEQASQISALISNAEKLKAEVDLLTIKNNVLQEEKCSLEKIMYALSRNIESKDMSINQ